MARLTCSEKSARVIYPFARSSKYVVDLDRIRFFADFTSPMFFKIFFALFKIFIYLLSSFTGEFAERRTFHLLSQFIRVRCYCIRSRIPVLIRYIVSFRSRLLLQLFPLKINELLSLLAALDFVDKEQHQIAFEPLVAVQTLA